MDHLYLYSSGRINGLPQTEILNFRLVGCARVFVDPIAPFPSFFYSDRESQDTEEGVNRIILRPAGRKSKYVNQKPMKSKKKKSKAKKQNKGKAGTAAD